MTSHARPFGSIWWPILWLMIAVGCGVQEPAPASPTDSEPQATAGVSVERVLDAGAGSDDWPSTGRTLAEQRFSPLQQIDASNVAVLQRRFTVELGTDRGLEATPLMLDGVLYFTLSWSVVMAVDARTGETLWTYDPLVPKETGRRACCDVVNRGVAAHAGRIYFGSLDGRLIALDAATGERVWEVLTVDPAVPYTITGAPRIIEGRVVIGNGGAEYGVRGYVSAYESDTGALAWRTYTVPGDPSLPFESPALERAAETWSGEWWKVGGGGTVWDSMAYDPELRLLYVGTGNGSPWVQQHRSPGGGDNLFLSSILALDPRRRSPRVALPDDARRDLGLHRDAAHHPGGSRDRRGPAQGAHAGTEERLLLRARSRDGCTDLGASVCDRHVGDGDRCLGPTDRSAEAACRG